jgi:hypothetical protein
MEKVKYVCIVASISVAVWYLATNTQVLNKYFYPKKTDAENAENTENDTKYVDMADISEESELESESEASDNVNSSILPNVNNAAPCPTTEDIPEINEIEKSLIHNDGSKPSFIMNEIGHIYI